MLLIVQSVAIQRRLNGFHKQMGQASFVLFPFLILGFMMIIDVSAQRYASADNPFILHNGPSFGFGMAIAIAAYLTLYYQALKTRRNVKLHAGYMLATPLILFESPFSRVIEQFLPWMNFIGSEGPQAVQDTIAISDGMGIFFAMTLYFLDRKHGAPWLVASFFMGLQAIVMWYAPYIPELGPMFLAYAQIPLAVSASVGVGAGALAAWLGWRASSRAKRPQTKVAV
ncbi:hypothetical protein [Sphingorhabdus pulchriflava]|uniref:hypothetical protein n=1 Tax=Sphingorhabdus pulchriflava TaxID=2292257 RepID=UPI0011C07F56|nr:hypothetical protein [Sphingorhabdus pulchriflava]